MSPDTRMRVFTRHNERDLIEWRMLAQASLLLLSVLWVLLCMRFYVAIARTNIMQRRMIAIGAGLGAGLIYILGSMVLDLLQSTAPAAPHLIQQVEDVRVQSR